MSGCCSTSLRHLFDSSSTLLPDCSDKSSTLLRPCFGISSTALRHFFDCCSTILRLRFDICSCRFDISSTRLRQSLVISCLFPPACFDDHSGIWSFRRTRAEQYPKPSRSSLYAFSLQVHSRIDCLHKKRQAALCLSTQSVGFVSDSFQFVPIRAKILLFTRFSSPLICTGT
jgi:hypothetical protein